MNFLKIIYEKELRKRVFCSESLSNFENVLQRNLRKDRARECIFTVSGGINLENFSAPPQSWWPTVMDSMCIPVCSKTLRIRHCKYLIEVIL